MPDAYSTAAEIDLLAGATGVDLRTDDGTEATIVAEAVDYAGGEVDFAAQGRWSSLDAVQWVRNAATHLALEWLCLRRLNAVPESLAAACERYRQQLMLVAQGKLVIPGAARSRRPVTLSNRHVDLRRFNNTVRTDTTKSTGVTNGYTRPTDPAAPDQR